MLHVKEAVWQGGRTPAQSTGVVLRIEMIAKSQTSVPGASGCKPEQDTRGDMVSYPLPAALGSTLSFSSHTYSTTADDTLIASPCVKECGSDGRSPLKLIVVSRL